MDDRRENVRKPVPEAPPGANVRGTRSGGRFHDALARRRPGDYDARRAHSPTNPGRFTNQGEA
jgi:hypothetical protein